MDILKISTITAVLQLSSDIDLKQVYQPVPITRYIPFIEFGQTITFGPHSNSTLDTYCAFLQ